MEAVVIEKTEYESLTLTLNQINKKIERMYQIIENKVYSTKEAAAYLGISTKSLDRARANGTIQYVDHGHKVLYTIKMLKQYQDSKIYNKKLSRVGA